MGTLHHITSLQLHYNTSCDFETPQIFEASFEGDGLPKRYLI